MGETSKAKNLGAPDLFNKLYKPEETTQRLTELSNSTRIYNNENTRFAGTRESMKLLKDFEATVIRAMFKVRKKAPITHLYQLSGIEPLEATLHKSCFGLFHNVWMNPDTPSSKFIKIILQNPSKYKLNYWPKHIQSLAKRYEIPDPAELLKRRYPDKEKWKMYIARKIETHHQRILADKSFKINQECP